MFVNLPVRELAVSRAFFTVLGYTFNNDFADETMETVANGGAAVGPTKDLGYVYTRGFADPDGHRWEATHFSGQ